MWVIIIKAGWSIVFFTLIAGILFLLVSWMRQRLRVRYEREHQINIHHKANFRSFYYLAVDAPQHPILRFCLMAGGLPLVEVPQPVIEEQLAVVSITPPKVAKTTEKPAKTVSHTPASSSQPIGMGQKVTDSSSQAVAKTGTLANLLGALAGLLPGSLGESVKRRQEEVRQAQVTASKAAHAPKQAQQRMTVLQTESQKLGANSSPAKQPAAIPAAAKQTSSTIASAVIDTPQVDQSGSADAPVNPLKHPFPGLYCVQTVELDPEQSLPLKLIISSTNGRPLIGSFAYNIHLQAVPLDHFQEKIPVLFRRGMVHFAPVSNLRSFISSFLSLLAFLLGLVFWFYLLALLWQ